MKFDAVELDAPITKEASADYWRERAECLEEWVCELLRKNQTLRMSRENDQRQHHESLIVNLATELSCPRKECAEIRESVILHGVVNDERLAN